MPSRDDLSAVARAACCTAANFAASSALCPALAFCRYEAGAPGATPTPPRAEGPLSTSIGAGCGLEGLETEDLATGEAGVTSPGCPGKVDALFEALSRGVRGAALAGRGGPAAGGMAASGALGV